MLNTFPLKNKKADLEDLPVEIFLLMDGVT